MMLAVPPAAGGNCFLRLRERQTQIDAQQKQNRNGQNPSHELAQYTTSRVSIGQGISEKKALRRTLSRGDDKPVIPQREASSGRWRSEHLRSME